MPTVHECLLCQNQAKNFEVPGDVNKRSYYHCDNCQLIFADPVHLVSSEEAKKRYLTHQNGIEYSGYVNFLNQALLPALKFLTPEMHGLDFGCGPNPTLSILLNQKNIQCDHYDPLFFPEIKSARYDFIFATECFEHFHLPKNEVLKIYEMLIPGGYLIIMTEKWTTQEKFQNWYYTNDFTHIVFYHELTIKYIADTFGFILLFSDNPRVSILRKLI